MPTRNVPRLTMSSRRDGVVACWASAETIARKPANRAIVIRNITSSLRTNSMAAYRHRVRFQTGADAPTTGIATVTISMYDSSVGVFSHFLGNLSGLLDHAAAYAETRNIDPSVLLHARLYPDMYDLTRQVGEANRHVVLSVALIAGVEPPVFPEIEPDIAELKARIATVVEFIGSLRSAQFDAAADKEVVFTFRNGN